MTVYGAVYFADRDPIPPPAWQHIAYSFMAVAAWSPRASLCDIRSPQTEPRIATTDWPFLRNSILHRLSCTRLKDDDPGDAVPRKLSLHTTPQDILPHEAPAAVRATSMHGIVLKYPQIC
jgi:hypothetical protein